MSCGQCGTDDTVCGRCMAKAILGSMVNLRTVVARTPRVQAIWRADPLGAIDLVIETIRARHLEGVPLADLAAHVLKQD